MIRDGFVTRALLSLLLYFTLRATFFVCVRSGARRHHRGVVTAR